MSRPPVLLAASLAAAALASACAPALSTARTAGPVDAAALIRLEDRREYDSTALAAAAEAPSAALRRRAALSAANLRDRRAIPLLGRMLADEDTSVAATAAFALGQIADSAAVPLLAPYVSNARIAAAPTVVGEAAYALGKIRHPAARAALEGLLAGATVDAAGTREAVGPALLGIWRQGRPTPVPAVARWLRSADPELRWRAAYALARRAEPATAGALFPAARDEDALVRSFVARVLTGPMADSSGVGRDRALQTLVALAGADTSMPVRVNALRTLGTYPGAAALGVLSDRAASARDPYDVIAALEGMQRMGADARSAAPLLASIIRDPARNVFVRQTAMAALVAVDSQAALQAVTAIETAPQWRLRASAARVYAAVSPASRQRLGAWLADPDGRVAAAALEEAVGATEDSIGEIRGVLFAALDHRDVIARTNALTGLAKLADPATLPRVLDAYGRAQRDSMNDAALAAVDAVGAIAKKDPAARTQFFARFPRSGDYLVRQRVQTAFADTVPAAWGAPLPVETGRRASEYARAGRETMGPRRRAVITTDRGEIEVEFFGQEAPLTVQNFLTLAQRGYFDGQEWPRVVPNFVIQGGDPRGDTSGGPGYAIRDEINRHVYGRGTLGMALSGPDTGGSQWFITHSPQPHLDGTYTVFGQVVRGMDVVDRILPGDRILRIREVR
ncbi:MAG TPA: peptidylprolyl isomerase [Longimicrobium sp.]|jgi:cyclophilin family peptidyl-prolyl cis-trans isomerase/HEAT repeat protein|uniref:peptidylprolyl isomerase n=1 Tax=Longimicrobium sp. TaxID=2029185 RepID=UPI002EDAA1C9